MILKLDLPPELEESARRRAAEKGMNLEAFLIEALRSEIVAAPVEREPKKEMSVEEFDSVLEEIANMNPPVTTFVDDSRESIYD